MPGQGNVVTHREIIRFEVQEIGTQKVRSITEGINVYNNGRREAIDLDKKQQIQYQNATPVQEQYSTSTRMLTRNIHMANMAVLGINMSLLGLSWNLQRAGIFSDETNEKIVKIVAPLQMVASVVNFAASSYQFYIMMSKIARTQSVLNASRIGSANTVLSISFHGLQISILSVVAAMGALAAIFGVFITKSPVLRAVLAGLGSAMLVYAFRTLIAAKAQALLLAMKGPVGWAAIIIGLGVALFAAASLAQMLSGGYGLWKGGIAVGRTQTTIGELGPEAVIPLSSPSGRRYMGMGGGGGGGALIENAYFNVGADRPATLWKNTNRAVKRQVFVEEGI